MKNLVNDPAYAEVKAELRKELDRWLARAELPFIPDEWRELSLPDRIARQNRHYTLLPFVRQWNACKAEAVVPYLAQAAAAGKDRQVRAAADQVFDEAFFGRYKALHNELNGQKRWSKRPLDELRTELAAHEKAAADRLRAQVAQILAGG